MRGRKRAFCCGVPKVTSTGPIMLTLKLSGSGAGAWCSSSRNIQRFTTLQPGPPCSRGQPGVAQPRLFSVRCQATISSLVSARPSIILRCTGAGSEARMKPRTSARNAFSSSLARRSIAAQAPITAGRGSPAFLHLDW